MIQKWLNKRITNRIRKSAVAATQHRPIIELFNHIEREHGKEARAHLAKTLMEKIGGVSKKYLHHEDPEKLLLRYESYLTDPDFKKKMHNEAPSNFHRSLMDSEVKAAWHRVSKTVQHLSAKDIGKSEDLEKSVEDKDWKRIQRSNKPDSALVVNHKIHIADHPAPADYKKIFSHPVDIESKHPDEITSGVSAKMVHDTDFVGHDQNTYMSKPYHKKIESCTKTWVKKPILGWATMATKELFNAGKIGHLCEDVTAHEHDGVPMTVHKFAEGYRDLTGPGRNPEVDPLQKQQIATMDYLTGNNDRHMGNLLVQDHSSPRGQRSLLAIDHERNFQYIKPQDRSLYAFGAQGGFRPADQPRPHESPYAQMKSSALNAVPAHQIGFSELADWWDTNGHDIRDKFNKQVEMIQDHDIRQHTTDNFMHRWNHINSWAKAAHSGEIDDSDHKTFHDAFKDTRIIKRQSPRITKKTIRDHLSQNKTDALASLSDIMNKKDNLSHDQWRTMKDTIGSIVQDMSPEEMTSFYRHAMDNPHLNTEKIRTNPDLNPKQAILRHISEPVKYENNEPVYKLDHLKAMRDFIDELPADRKEMLQYWRDKFDKIVSDQETPEKESA